MRVFYGQFVGVFGARYFHLSPKTARLDKVSVRHASTGRCTEMHSGMAALPTHTRQLRWPAAGPALPCTRSPRPPCGRSCCGPRGCFGTRPETAPSPSSARHPARWDLGPDRRRWSQALSRWRCIVEGGKRATHNRKRSPGRADRVPLQ